jgi:transposase
VVRITAALAADALAAPSHRVRAKAGAIQLAAQQLLLLQRQRATWRKHLASLLEGEGAHPDGELVLSLPGLDTCLAARVLGEIGNCRERFPTPSALQCYAGTAPVTKASGRLRVVSARWACNRFLRQALQRWAFCSLTHSAWARAFYDRQRARGKTHHAALRALANRWLEILHHLLLTGQRYDEAVHRQNSTKLPLPHAA